MTSNTVHRWIDRVWYGGSAGIVLLLPFALLFRAAQAARAALFEAGILRRVSVGVPVIVVGNITAGGTGKTPVTIWLAQELRARGFRPGIASRGYRGKGSGGTIEVGPASAPGIVGDEPVVLARRCHCPVAVDADRARAAAHLVERGCDVIVADDGLQHYRLDRDFEICVIDAVRGLGNGWPLPAGPLREPARRLTTVDQVLVNGGRRQDEPDGLHLRHRVIHFELVASEARRPDHTSVQPLANFAGRRVHALAGIGNPQRFFDLLRGHGLQIIEHAYPDHAQLEPADFEFGDEFDILVTEKDAVKLARPALDRIWYVPVNLQMNASDAEHILDDIQSRLGKAAARQ